MARSWKGSSKRGISSPRTITRQKMSKFSAVGGKLGLPAGGDIASSSMKFGGI